MKGVSRWIGRGIERAVGQIALLGRANSAPREAAFHKESGEQVLPRGSFTRNEITCVSALRGKDIVRVERDRRFPIVDVRKFVERKIGSVVLLIGTGDPSVVIAGIKDRLQSDHGVSYARVNLVLDADVGTSVEMAGCTSLSVASDLGVPKQCLAKLLGCNRVFDVRAHVWQNRLNAGERRYICDRIYDLRR
ncbi:hypothetical protein [Hyphomicrobium sp. 99]|uniref:hypothetical protein n=1 Tax=Hyphomicrobium sp. 99 TaxID=1163419 RepID=UPI003529AC76